MSEREFAELNAAIAALRLDYSAEFVPQSKSRNAGDKQPSINWRVTLSRPGCSTLALDYAQGIAYAPGCEVGRRTLEGVERETDAAEHGEYSPRNGRRSSSLSRLKLPAPLLRDVLYCLINDSAALDYSCFEEWAPDYGYETDSRKAEAIYRECLEHALQLRALIGQPAIDQLRELFQDY
jgi:hypothetical protein